MKNPISTSIKMLLIMTVIVGVAYPMVVTGVGQLFFHGKANGSIVYSNGRAVGSMLIGQSFSSERYFWSRPSAVAYSSSLSGCSNLGPISQKLDSCIASRSQYFRAKNGIASSDAIPADIVTASGSGLDPHITVAAALLQVDRVASARRFSDVQKNRLIELIHKNSRKVEFASINDEYINVLALNLNINSIK